MPKIICILCVSVLLIACLTGCDKKIQTQNQMTPQRNIASVNIIPAPSSITPTPGVLPVTGKTKFYLTADPADKPLTEWIKASCKNHRLYKTKKPWGKSIPVKLQLEHKNASAESYTIEIKPQAVHVKSPSMHGMQYALTSLAQLIQNAKNTPASLPCCTITDSPRFVYRGMHLDVARHCMPVEFIKKHIDILAEYKFNTLHLHLTEDQGWRIDIEKYPRLREIAQWRKTIGFEHNQKIGLNTDPGTPCGGIYTKHQLKQLVAYAKQRFINIIPEIEMPGHSTAALAAYPDLGCTQGPYEVLTEAAVSPHIYCAGREQTFEFLQNVLLETMEIFPSKYIHIGGDEAPKQAWKNCTHCQRRIRENNLQNEQQLQSWFVKRIEKFLNAHGRKLIGWDEILQGGLSPGATVMSWRGFEGGLEAAHQGHDVIITPSQFTYFNFRQDQSNIGPGHPWLLPIEKVYAFEPMHPDLEKDRQKHVLGGQGCLWTEYIPKPEHAEYQLYPRICALAEALWTQPEKKDFARFSKRLETHYALDLPSNLNYYIPPPAGYLPHNVFTEPFDLEIKNPSGKGVIRYTTSRSEPTAASKKYDSPIHIDKDITIKSAVFWPEGKKSLTRTGAFKKQQPAEPAKTKNPTPGIKCTILPGDFNSAENLDPSQAGQTLTAVAKSFENPFDKPLDYYGLVYEGIIEIPKTAVYTFYVKSRHGGVLYINNKLVVDNDGFHSAFEHTGQTALQKGPHPLKLKYFKTNLPFTLEVSISSDDMPKQIIKPAMLFHQSAQ